MKKRMPINLPNLLTLLRLCLVPVFLWVFFCLPQSGSGHPLAAGVLLLAGLTDVLDGFLARRLGLITEWGKTYDPLADKLVQSAALAAIWSMLPQYWMLYTFLLLKEAVVLLGGLVIYKKNHHVASAQWFGKLANVIFYIAGLIIIYDGGLPDSYALALLGLLLAAMLFAGVRYLVFFLRQTSKTLQESNQPK